MKPNLMPFDEPTSALDPEMIKEVLVFMTGQTFSQPDPALEIMLFQISSGGGKIIPLTSIESPFASD